MGRKTLFSLWFFSAISTFRNHSGTMRERLYSTYCGTNPGWTEKLWRSGGGLRLAINSPAGSWPPASGGAPLHRRWGLKKTKHSLKTSSLWPVGLSRAEIFWTFALLRIILWLPIMDGGKPKERSRLRTRPSLRTSTLSPCQVKEITETPETQQQEKFSQITERYECREKSQLEERRTVRILTQEDAKRKNHQSLLKPTVSVYTSFTANREPRNENWGWKLAGIHSHLREHQLMGKTQPNILTCVNPTLQHFKIPPGLSDTRFFVIVSLKGHEQPHGQNLKLGLLQHAVMEQKHFFISVSKSRPGRNAGSNRVKSRKQVCAFSTPTFPRHSPTVAVVAAPPRLVSRLSQAPHSRLLASFWTFPGGLRPQRHSSPSGASRVVKTHDGKFNIHSTSLMFCISSCSRQ